MKARLRIPVLAGMLAAAIATSIITLARPAPADAHPLGNFTVNRYSRIEVYSDAVRVRYVLDMAEIPAYQEKSEVDSDGDGSLSPAESDAYVARKSGDIAGALRLEINGSRAALNVLTRDIAFPEGQAGLNTLRINALLEVRLSEGAATLSFEDENYGDRVGWSEIVVRPSDGVRVSGGTFSRTDVSQELTTYPEDLLSSPLNVRSSEFEFDASGGEPAPAVNEEAASLEAPAKAPERAGGSFASLIDTSDPTVGVVIIALLAAFGFGAIHALEPGHGKTFVAAYFVGTRGTVRQVLSLGLIVAGTHTVGVIAIGLLTLFGSSFVLPEKLYPWLSLASGLMVLMLGLRLLVARARGWRALRAFVSLISQRPRSTTEHAHPHEAHTHSHLPPTDAPSPWKGLVALGLADGLTPSPSALVVLLAAVSLDRVALGLGLVVSFSVGLAAVLSLVSLALVFARRVAEWIDSEGLSQATPLRWLTGGPAPGRVVLQIAPLGGAMALLIVGGLLTLRALSQPGLPLV